MKNKYGYFAYYEINPDTVGYANINIIGTPQEIEGNNLNIQNGLLSTLGDHRTPYNVASFEFDSYDTENPKRLCGFFPEYLGGLVEGVNYSIEDGYKASKVGYISNDLSNNNGIFTNPVSITITCNNILTFSGITIFSTNTLNEINVIAYQGDMEYGSYLLNPKKVVETDEGYYDYWFDKTFENVNKIKITISKIGEPLRFLRIGEIEFGDVVIYDDNRIISAEVAEYATVYGENLEYDTATISVFDDRLNDYILSKSQRIDYFERNENENIYNLQEVYYLDDVQKNYQSNTAEISAYNRIYALEKRFYGGIYRSVNFENIINEIFSGTDINYYVSPEISTMSVSGYIPVCTKREALNMILVGTNTIFYEDEGIFHLTKIFQEGDIVFNETNVLKDPQITSNPAVKEVTFIYHYYEKLNEEVEIYRGNLTPNVNKTFIFDEPLHSLNAYEVTYDNDDNEIIYPTNAVNFVKKHDNYCIISVDSNTEIVLKGKKYNNVSLESTTTMTDLSSNMIYDTVEVESTIYSNPDLISQHLFNYKNRKQSIVFLTFEKPKVGRKYLILGRNYFITSVKNRFNGLYEVKGV